MLRSVVTACASLAQLVSLVSAVQAFDRGGYPNSLQCKKLETYGKPPEEGDYPPGMDADSCDTVRTVKDILSNRTNSGNQLEKRTLRDGPAPELTMGMMYAQFTPSHPVSFWHTVKISWPEKCFHRYVEFVLDCSEGNDNKWQCFDFSESRPPLYIHAGNFCSMSNVNHPPPAWNGFYFDNLWVYFANQQKNAPTDCYRDWIEGNYNQLGIYQIQGTCYFDDAIGAEPHGYDPDDDNTATVARAAEFMA